MNSDFVEMVTKMRQAQKDYFNLVTSKEAPMKRAEISDTLRRAKFYEGTVDKMLVAFKDKTRQLLLLDLTKRTDETPGAYNVEHETKSEEGGAT